MKPSKTVKFKSKDSIQPVSGPEFKPAAPVAIQSLGPRRIANSVLFVASFPNAKSVNIAGDFNGWKPEKNPMSKANDGTWQVSIPLARGVYKYRFVVDGKWHQDPHNKKTEPNEYGDLNSVLKVD
ncbi:MAG: isoamylase early set domain-containing protein [Sedimentisphaerales bacterium]|nr:isoamylase early set domain-containing protein [Sedimentisphaerales bacterium]